MLKRTRHDTSFDAKQDRFRTVSSWSALRPNFVLRISVPYTDVAVVKGRIAMFRALFTAAVTCLWCFAQFPEILRGMILPRSVMKYLRTLGFL